MKNLISFVAVTLLAASVGCTSPRDESRGQYALIGRWQSVKAEGKDAAFWRSVTKTAELRFSADGSFTAIVVQREGKTETVSGTYQADDRSIRLALQNAAPAKPAEYCFEAGSLVVQDPNYGYRVFYKRITDE